MTEKWLFSSLVLLATTACAHTSGFRSGDAPGVLVVTDGSASHLKGTPSRITLTRDQTETWSMIVDALLKQADASGIHYLAGLKIQWFEIRSGQTLRCDARIEPRLFLPGQDPGGLAAYGLARSRPNLPSSPPNAAAAEALKQQPGSKASYGQAGMPSAIHPRSLAFVTDPEWSLTLEDPACTSTAEPATSRVDLIAMAY